jgi:hypothetical protein
MKHPMIAEEIFTEKEMSEIAVEAIEGWKVKRNPLWLEIKNLDQKNKTTMGKIAKRIYEKIRVNGKIEINNKSGLEIWININKKHGLHYDCDEALRKLTGLIKHPILSSVYYLEIPDEGGELVLYKNATKKALQDVFAGNKKSQELGIPEIIRPRKNNLVVFESKIPHYVEGWVGGKTRISIAANLWLNKPTDPDRPFNTLIETM